MTNTWEKDWVDNIFPLQRSDSQQGHRRRDPLYADNGLETLCFDDYFYCDDGLTTPMCTHASDSDCEETQELDVVSTKTLRRRPQRRSRRSLQKTLQSLSRRLRAAPTSLYHYADNSEDQYDSSNPTDGFKALVELCKTWATEPFHKYKFHLLITHIYKLDQAAL
jgi:hypothetical protein